MITSQEYLRHSDLQRDFLTAFSALDHSVTETMGTGQVQACFELLVSRLAAICALHGPGTARNFLQAVADTPPAEALATAIAYLEIGHPPAHDMERAMVERRELQQEILHFSRIVALPELQGGAIPQNKRLRNSKLIPEQVKVVCEFLTVARGRILQRGKAVPTPRARPDQQGNTPWGSGRLLVHDRELSDYVLVIACDQASVQKDLAFLWASLLTYLTPRESLSALCLHLLEGHPACGLVGFTLLEPGAGDRLRVTHCRPAPLGGGEGAGRLQQAVANLPEELEVPAGEGWISFSGPDPVEARLTAAQDRGRRLLELRTPDPAVPAFRIGLAHAGHFARSREETVAEALHLFRNRHEARVQVASIESAHIHLDRQIDEDQILGSAIGHALHGHLATVQAQPPRLNPMVDDDHVLVQLAARDYEAFFRDGHPGLPFELLPESSPIIRAIACSLWAHVAAVPAKGRRFLMQGDNLVLKVPEENILCELFEDFHGKCDTGCVLFEVALLIYRSDPAYFSEAFHRHFGLEEDVHQRILAALDPRQPHDAIIQELGAYKERFRSVLDPHHPSACFMDLVGAFLARQDQVYVHLNVLEDYYEAQQFKVRRLLRFMGLPIQLASLHFNRLTGRVHLERRVQPREEGGAWPSA